MLSVFKLICFDFDKQPVVWVTFSEKGSLFLIPVSEMWIFSGWSSPWSTVNWVSVSCEWNETLEDVPFGFKGIVHPKMKI